jgi:hypothetical protein
MTREEAIKWIIYEKDSIDTEGYCATKENYARIQALDMAIEALQILEAVKRIKAEILSQVEPTIRKIAFACDGRKCGGDCSNCGRTTDIEHAKNFNHIGDIYFEKLPGVGIFDTEHDHCDGVIKYTGENYKI